MIKIELDTAQPCDFSAIDKFYENNLNSIVKLDSPSPSLKTISSSSSIAKAINRQKRSSESSTASDSDQDEGLELDSAPTKDKFLKYQTSPSSSSVCSSDRNVIVINNADNNLAQANGTRIESVAIQNSSDIQFGNKTFYNGPVTIKQFLLDDKHRKWISRTSEEIAQIENGVSNKGFDGKIAWLMMLDVVMLHVKANTFKVLSRNSRTHISG